MSRTGVQRAPAPVLPVVVLVEVVVSARERLSKTAAAEPSRERMARFRITMTRVSSSNRSRAQAVKARRAVGEAAVETAEELAVAEAAAVDEEAVVGKRLGEEMALQLGLDWDNAGAGLHHATPRG